MSKIKPFPLILGVLIMSFLVGYIIFAWTEPSTSPPGGNVAAPINVGGTAQTKTGALTVTGGLTSPILYDQGDTHYWINPDGTTYLAGNIGIGIASPTDLGANRLRIRGATNDSTAFGLMIENSAGSAALFAVRNDGNVGIWTSSPEYKLDVNGALRLKGSSQPTGANGVIYYDSATNKFRCYQNGGWEDNCMGAGAISWPLLAPQSLETNPQYSFSGDTNTGIFQPSGVADTVAFSTAGTERLRINAAGDVGIGTTSLGAKLDISNSASSRGLRVSTAYAAVNNYGILGSATGGSSQNYGGQFSAANALVSNIGIISSASGPAGSNNYALYGLASCSAEPCTKWGLYVAGGNAYFAGNVGIGTTGPNTALDINGALSIRGMAAPVVSPASQGRIYFDSTANKFKVSENSGAYVDLVGAGAANAFIQGGNSFSALATLGTNDNYGLVFETNNTERVRIDTTGNVGIGTTSPDPSYRLTIDSSAATKYGIKVVANSDQPAAYITNTGTGYGLIVDKGDVGIGTTNPASKLEVSGNVAVTGGNQLTLYSLGKEASLNYEGLFFKSSATLQRITSGWSGTGAARPIVFDFNGAEKMRITPDGNVGIGTDSPGTNKLKVVGATEITGNLKTANIVAPTDYLTLMPATASNFVQVGYEGTPRDLYVWGNLTVGGGVSAGSVVVKNPSVSSYGEIQLGSAILFSNGYFTLTACSTYCSSAYTGGICLGGWDGSNNNIGCANSGAAYHKCLCAAGS